MTLDDATLPDGASNLPHEGRSKFAEHGDGELREGVISSDKEPNPFRNCSAISTSPQEGGSGRVLRHPAELAAAGLIAPAAVATLDEVAGRYAVAVTPAMASLIDPADPADPIARQFVPDARELTTTPDELADPIGDGAHEVTPGLIHRYPDRVLLKFVSSCAVYCRFCFRRETVGQGEGLSPTELSTALDYIRATPAIFEVIVSGGDPLVASPRRLAALVRELAAIPHVELVRFHTRVPVVAPERITPELVAALKAEGIATWVAIHANHPRELTDDARAALAKLADAGIPLVSQSVLLRGVNDDAETLAALMRAFLAARVKPYYLHHADLAPGTAHFRTTIAEGEALMKMLRGRVSGLAQPTYVLDIPGGHGKVPVGPSYRDGDIIEDYRGATHRYPPGG
jgi:lysine 2,3-aminomutase